MREAEGLASVLRLTLVIAAATCAAVVLVAFLTFGHLAAALAAGGSALGLLNLWVAAGALRRMPALFVGSSLPRLAVVTAALLVLVVSLGPVAAWAIAGLLVTHLVEVAAVLRFGMKQMAGS